MGSPRGSPPLDLSHCFSGNPMLSLRLLGAKQGAIQGEQGCLGPFPPSPSKLLPLLTRLKWDPCP